MALKKLERDGSAPLVSEVIRVAAMPVFVEQASVISHSLSEGEGKRTGVQFFRCDCDFLKQEVEFSDQLTCSAEDFPAVRDSNGAKY